MARAPDPRIEQAKAMYLQGMKLVEIASQLSLPEGTVRRWKCTHKWEKETFGYELDKKTNVRIRKEVDSQRIKMLSEMAVEHLNRIRMLKNTDSSASISRMKHGRFFLPLNRLIRLICCGIRYRLPMLQSLERRELHMLKIRQTRPLRRSKRKTGT